MNHLKPGTTEVMMHPGVDNERLLKDCGWDHDYEAELASILSPEIMDMIRKKNVKVVNFGELGG